MIAIMDECRNYHQSSCAERDDGCLTRRLHGVVMNVLHAKNAERNDIHMTLTTRFGSVPCKSVYGDYFVTMN